MEHIKETASSRLICRALDNNSEAEFHYYCASEDYELQLNYLIETWVSNIENEFYYDIDYDGNFDYISKYFEDGRYCPDFNNEWLDDIFVRHILATSAVCLK